MPSHAPGFFRILLPGFSKRLPLPAAFVQHIIREKSNRNATLINPNGRSWCVDVYIENKNVHFGGDCWMEFVNAHGLVLGYFLVFSYKGDMAFEFRAYDLSTCEISYPSIVTESVDDPKMKKKKKKKRVALEETKKCCYSAASSKKMREDVNEKKTVEEMKIENLDNMECSNSTSSPKKSNLEVVKFEKELTSYSAYKPYVNIPADFVEEHSELKKIDELTLKDPKGRLWSVKLFHRKSKYKRGSGMHLSSGWTKFASANELKVGDRCHFELLIQEKLVNVQIIRSAGR